jgi:uncharacterized membrane protein
MQFVANLTVLFNVPIARPIIGFIYLTFVPGVSIVKLLKIKTKNWAESILFAAGLSIAFIMVVGLFVNEFNPLFGVMKPLSLTFLLPVIDILVLVCTVAAHFRGDNRSDESFNFEVKNTLAIFLLLCIPLLSIVGAITSGAYEDNRILLFMVILIAAIFIVTLVFRNTFTSKLYSLIVMVIALSLVYHAALVSDKLIHFGSDVPGEVFVQKNVEREGYWNSKGLYPGDQSIGRSYAMLSVTLLPTIYSILLNLDSILIFKLFYSLLWSLVPLGLYILWKNFVGEKFAFASVFLFMSFQPFYGELLGLNKQILAGLFLVLLLNVLLFKNENKLAKNICLILFSFSLVVSHYGLAEIFLFFIVFALVFLIITRRHSAKGISVTFVLFYFALMFTWYMFTSSSAVYDAFLSFGQRVYNELGDFFSLQSREPEILRGLGLEPPPTVWNLMSRVFAYFTEFFIFIGFLCIVIKNKQRNKFGREFFLFICVAMLFLFVLIVVPGLSGTMGMSRFYNVLLFFIAPLCPIGAETLVKFVFKRGSEFKTIALLLIVLASYFLFQIGFVYEVTQTYSWSVPLSKHRMSRSLLYSEFGYVDSSSILGSRWLSENVKVPSAAIYSDRYSRVNELRAYGIMYVGHVEILSNTTLLKTGDVIYLNPLNVIQNMMVGSRYFWNTSDLQFLSEINKVYSSGEVEIFKNALH